MSSPGVLVLCCEQEQAQVEKILPYYFPDSETAVFSDVNQALIRLAEDERAETHRLNLVLLQALVFGSIQTEKSRQTARCFDRRRFVSVPGYLVRSKTSIPVLWSNCLPEHLKTIALDRIDHYAAIPIFDVSESQFSINWYCAFFMARELYSLATEKVLVA